MYTSQGKQNKRTSQVYLCVAAALAAFSAVYESLSHGVYSGFMVFLFAWPLLGGALPFALLSRRKIVWPARCLYHSGLAALTVGSCVQGILDIYGTMSDYMVAYWVAGGILIVCGVLAQLVLGHGDEKGE